MSNNVVTLKSGSEVTQGHWKWYHSIDWVWFTMCSIVTLSLSSWDIWLVSIHPWVRITQGHRNRRESIRRLWLPINVP